MGLSKWKQKRSLWRDLVEMTGSSLGKCQKSRWQKAKNDNFLAFQFWNENPRYMPTDRPNQPLLVGRVDLGHPGHMSV